LSAAKAASYSAGRIAKKVAGLAAKSRKITTGGELMGDYAGPGIRFLRRMFAKCAVSSVLPLVREEVRDVEHAGQSRREFFQHAAGLKGRDCCADAVLESGVTQDFLLRRLGETKPRSLAAGGALDKTSKRRMPWSPILWVRTASKEMWVGYGLAAQNGTDRNLKDLSSGALRRLIVNRNRGRGKK